MNYISFVPNFLLCSMLVICWRVFLDTLLSTFSCATDFRLSATCSLFNIHCDKRVNNLPVLHLQCLYNLCLLCGIAEYCSGFMSLGGSKWRYHSIAHALLMWRSTQCMYYFMCLVYWHVCVSVHSCSRSTVVMCPCKLVNIPLYYHLLSLYQSSMYLCSYNWPWHFCNFHFTDRRPDFPGTVILFDPALEFIFSNCLASAIFSFVLRTGVWL